MEKEHIISGQKPRYEILDGLRGVAALVDYKPWLSGG